jgi:hypothetical protein
MLSVKKSLIKWKEIAKEAGSVLLAKNLQLILCINLDALLGSLPKIIIMLFLG